QPRDLGGGRHRHDRLRAARPGAGGPGAEGEQARWQRRLPQAGDQLFPPDGYYEEGPYYQRYALAPFILFANAVQRNEPERGIFKRRDGVLLKAV
ncbi:hypothetical protein, partial [Pseudomonas viridiflava]|uniref:hypothetical protein n=1 Tax=Pseudomonas viridiflava TaxID=33069 RepID=UPI00197EF676